MKIETKSSTILTTQPFYVTMSNGKMYECFENTKGELRVNRYTK